VEAVPVGEVREDVAGAEVIEAQEWRRARDVLGEEHLQLRPQIGERLAYMPSTRIWRLLHASSGDGVREAEQLQDAPSGDVDEARAAELITLHEHPFPYGASWPRRL
jgi:hypothetical protein